VSDYTAVEQMHQKIIVEAVTYVVDDKSFSVIQNLLRVPWPVSYHLHELFMFRKAET